MLLICKRGTSKMVKVYIYELSVMVSRIYLAGLETARVYATPHINTLSTQRTTVSFLSRNI
jgi:hypothetical protein